MNKQDKIIVWFGILIITALALGYILKIFGYWGGF